MAAGGNPGGPSGAIAQLAARLFWEQEAAGSSPVCPTMLAQTTSTLSTFSLADCRESPAQRQNTQAVEGAWPEPRKPDLIRAKVRILLLPPALTGYCSIQNAAGAGRAAHLPRMRSIWSYSSVGRASGKMPEGPRFDPGWGHKPERADRISHSKIQGKEIQVHIIAIPVAVLLLWEACVGTFRATVSLCVPLRPQLLPWYTAGFE